MFQIAQEISTILLRKIRIQIKKECCHTCARSSPRAATSSQRHWRPDTILTDC